MAEGALFQYIGQTKAPFKRTQGVESTVLNSGYPKPKSKKKAKK